MPHWLSLVWAQLAVWFAVMAGLWKGAECLNGIAAPEAKKKTAYLLKTYDVSHPLKLIAETCQHIFDMVFGRKHLSLRCFLRSCTASCTTFFVLVVLTTHSLFSEIREYPTDFFGLLMITVLINFAPDYVSLLKSRFILSRMAEASTKKFWMLLLSDIFLSWLIGLIVMCIAALFFFGASEQRLDRPQDLAGVPRIFAATNSECNEDNE